MALTFKLEESQAERLIEAVNSLSDNLAKWQSEQSGVIERGFDKLVETLGGTDNDELQEQVNRMTEDLKSSNDLVEAAIQQSQL
jgi:hypothetical protein